MQTLRRFSPLLLSLLLGACSGVKVKTEHAPDAVAVASSYRTYTWVPSPPGDAQHAFGANAHVSTAKSVDGYLQSRGYQRVEANASPDFLIQWKGDIERLPVVSSGLGSEGGSTWESSDKTLGVLDLHILDAGTQKPMWWGTIRGPLPDHASFPKRKPTDLSANVQTWLDQSVPKLLADFPPVARSN